MSRPTFSSPSSFFAIAASFSWARTRPLIQRATFRLRAWALALAGIIAALLLPATVSAEPWLLQCELTPAPGKFRFDVPSSLTINPALPVGAIVGTYYASAGVSQFQSTCGNTGFVASHTSHLDIFLPGPSTETANGAMRIAGTNLGFKFVGYTGGPAYESGGYVIQNTSLFKPLVWVRNQSTTQDVYNNGTMALQIVVMGPVASGEVIPGGVIGRVQATDIDNMGSPGAALKYYDIELSNSITFTVQTCTVQSRTVNLGSHNLDGGPGAFTPATAFPIQLANCPTGIPIFYRIDPSTGIVPPGGSGMYSALMMLDSTSTAAGVGIELLNMDGYPHVLAYKHQLTAGYASPDNQLWLQARYRQIVPTVTPGSANASATITITYQ